MGTEVLHRGNLPTHESLSCISTSTAPQHHSMRSGSTVVQPQRPPPRHRSHTTGHAVPSDQPPPRPLVPPPCLSTSNLPATTTVESRVADTSPNNNNNSNNNNNNNNNNPPSSRQNSRDEPNIEDNPEHRPRSRPPFRQRQRKEHFVVSDKYLLCMSLWCLFFAVVSMILSGLNRSDPFSYTWKDRTFREKDYEVCIKCASLQHNPNEGGFIHYMTTKMEDGEIFCCASNSKQMSSLVEQVLKQQKYVPEALTPKENELHKDVPSAHKLLLLPESYKSGIVHLDINLKSDSHFVHARRVGERNSALVIQHPGLYYVYSSVMYRNDSVCEKMKHKTWHHYIERSKPGDIENAGALVKTAHTCCQGCSADKQTSFAGGVFRLQKNDIIYVTVTRADAIMFEPNATYMGLVMMGSVQDSSEGERERL